METFAPRLRPVLAALFFTVWPSLLPAQEIDCGAPQVDFRNNTVFVDPSGLDDTANIQCALDFARDNSIPAVRLTDGEFAISQVAIEGFKGALQGNSIAATSLEIIDQSMDCTIDPEIGRIPAPFKFIGGSPSLRTMTVSASQPCMGESSLLSIVHFTGEPATAECGNDLVFAAVDRVRFEDPDTGTVILAGVSAWAEGFVLGSCRNVLTGSLKVNRSEFVNLQRGVWTSMHAGAQVDLAFNQFINNRSGYLMERTLQNTNVVFNEFSAGDNLDINGYVAITSISGGPEPPSRSNLIVSNNTFNLSGANLSLFGLVTFYPNSTAQLSLVVKDNTFNMANEAIGVDILNVSNAVVINNRFVGGGIAGAWLGSERVAVNPVSADNVVVSNNFNELATLISDVYLDSGTVRNFVGAGQNATVLDLGTDNTVAD